LVDKDNRFIIQEQNQFIYFADNADGLPLYNGDIPYDASTATFGHFLSSFFGDANFIPGLSGSSFINKGSTGNPSIDTYSALGEDVGGGLNDWDSGSTFATVVAPQVNSIKDLVVDSSASKSITNQEIITIPLNIYWKFLTSTITTVDVNNLSMTPSFQHKKTLRVRLHPSSTSGVFDFKITFNIKPKNS
jgi:hypothetical protein